MSTTPHHYIVSVSYWGSNMESELRFHSPQKARDAMEWLFSQPDVRIISCPNLGAYISRGEGHPDGS